jgi:hypothetical protein
MQGFYGKIILKHSALRYPPNVYRIAGNVKRGGINQQNVIVRLIDQTDNSEIARTTTDVNGNFEFKTGVDVRKDTRRYHVTVEYDDGTQLWNDKSKPFITGIEA